MGRLLRSFSIWCALAAVAAALCPPSAVAADDDRLAIAYTGENYGGDSWEMDETGEYDLDDGFELPNDSIRSIRVRPGYRVVLYEHSEFGGKSAAFERDTPLFAPAWRAQASSLRVEEADESGEAEAGGWLAAVDGGGEGETLDALPRPDQAYAVIHADDLAYASTRLGHSFLLSELLGGLVERDAILEALRDFPPVESVSLIREYLSYEYHGAVRLTRHGRKLLDFLPGGARAGGREDYCVHFPFGRILQVRAAREDDGLFSVLLSAESPFYLHLNFHVSVSDDGGILFIGSGPEEAKRAREVFEGGGERADISRKTERKSFILVEDTGDGDDDFPLTEDFLRGVFGLRVEPTKGASSELSWDLSDNAVNLSIRHNLIDSLVGGMKLPQAAIDPDDPGLGFGGGVPWLTGIVGIGLNEDSLLDLLIGMFGGEKDEARKFLKRQGIDPASAAAALRSLGIVLGGEYQYRRVDLKGGYVFLSGDPEGMRQCKPFIKEAISRSLGRLEAVERDGWDLFYVAKPGDEWQAELHERFGWGSPYFIGMRDGVLLAGALDEEHLLDRPEIDRSSLDGDSFFRISLSPAALSSLLAGLKGPQLMVARAGMEELSMRPREAMDIIRALIHCQEIERVTLDVTGRDSAELSIDTRDVDYEEAWDLLRLMNVISGIEE